MPANRYAEMAVEVRDICRRYGIHYNTGSMVGQFSQVIWRILRHSFPSRPTKVEGVLQALDQRSHLRVGDPAQPFGQIGQLQLAGVGDAEGVLSGDGVEGGELGLACSRSSA